MPEKKKRSYHHGDLRRTLLEASLELIEESGLEALSLREVARRAGVSPGAPYHHFESREALLAALALDGFTLLEETMIRARDAAVEGDSIERFAAIGEAYVRFALAHPAHFRLMFRRSVVPNEVLPSTSSPGQAFQVLLDIVSELIGKDSVRAHTDRSTLVLLAWSIVHGAADLLLDGPLAAPHPALDVRPDDVPALVTRGFGQILRALNAPVS